MRTIKVFISGRAQTELSKQYDVIEKYPAFVLLQVSDRKAEELARSYPVEDMSSSYTIQTETRRIDTKRPRVQAGRKPRARAAGRDSAALSRGQHHYLVQFVGPIKNSWLRSVRQSGGELRAPYGNFTYVVRANKAAVGRITKLPFVRWTGHLPFRDRVSAGVTSRTGARRQRTAPPTLPRTRLLDGVYVVEFFDANDLTQAQPQIEKLGFKILNRTPSAKKLVVQTDAGDPQFQRQIDGLSAVHGVRMIQNRSLKRPSNNVARTFMGTARTTTSVGSGLNGRGETIAVCDAGLDTGDPATIHGDFAGRVAWIKSYPITPDLSSYILNPGANDGPADRNEGHGTHVAGSVLGSGAESLNISNLPSPIRGMAPDAKLVFQAVEQEMEWKSTALFDKFGRYGLWGLPDDLKQLFADAYAKKAHVHSNSWGGGDAGAYDDQCQQLDEFVWTHKDFCILVAAGNDGSDADGDGKINLTSVTSPATAKNCITVGASESKRTQFNYRTYGGSWSDYPVAPFKDDPMANNPNQVAAFSSRGPTTDGRIKPDVVAPGTFILSTRSRMIALNNKAWAPYPGTNLYFYMGGTSMATPLTSGAVALLRQYLRTVKKITNPSAALLKAALIFGATRLPGYAAAGAVVDNHQGYGRVDLDAVTSPTRGAVVFKDVTQGLRTGQQQTFSVTLKNAPFFRAVLAYTDYPAPTLVNNLNLIVTSPSGKMYIGNGGATSGLLQADSKNNVEVVHVRTPGNGAWKIDVVGSNVPHGPQDFALTFLGPRNP